MIAGGGTGGHLFPALAVAEVFQERDPENRVLFVGSRRGLEATVLSREGYAFQAIEAASLKGKSLWGKFRSLAAVPRSLVQSWLLIRSFKPDLVLGVGGYASGPVVLTAWAMGVKTAVQEQNAFPGLSNRILGKGVDRVFISFAGSDRHFPRGKAILTGNPVRKMIRQNKGVERKEPHGQFTLLVFGGSQGAHHLNEAMGEALLHLGELKDRLRVIHQTGQKDFNEVQQAYQGEGVKAEVWPFIYDMDRAYAAADLILCRAGATTLFEVMAVGKPAILVPYPYAANDHQTLNAKTLADAGAAWMIPNGDLTGAYLGGILRELSGDPGRLKAMGDRAAALARPDAARTIVNSCYELVGHG